LNRHDANHYVTTSLPTNTTSRRVILFAILFVCLLANLYIAKWGFANMISTRADTTDVADLAVNLGPSDPQTHYTAAVLFDKTFLAADQQRSMSEYETALALSPHNYLLWLEYGKALSRNGEFERAEAALRQQIDVVFAAGNCGAFCPAQRCGKLDRGAGSSIWGGNSSSAVITTGAVLTSGRLGPTYVG